MEDNFLKKEKEFKEENKLLELRTKELLQKVDDIKKMQEFQLLDFRPDVKIEPKDLRLPKSVDEMGTKGMIHFYKSKVKTLQDDLGKAQNELKNKSEELKKLQKSHHTISEEKEKWFLQYNVERNSNTKLEKQISAWTSKVQIKENENATLKKEIEQLKSDLKSSCNELNASENRLKRALQDNEKHVAVLKTLREEEKVFKVTHKNSIQDLTATVKQIQKHKNELLQGYKKQLQLIDNLKRQKTHIENCKVVDLMESEFFKLLEWKID